MLALLVLKALRTWRFPMRVSFFVDCRLPRPTPLWGRAGGRVWSLGFVERGTGAAVGMVRGGGGWA